MKVVAFGGWAVLSEHMSTTAFLIENLAGVNAATTHCLFKIQKIKRAATHYHIVLQAGKI